MIPVALLGTGSCLPGRRVSTKEVAEAAQPPLDPAYIRERSGIETRYWVEPGTRAAPIAAEVLKSALTAARMAPTDLRRIIFTSSTGGDWLIPSTASRVAHELGLSGQCECFDINNACVSFLTGFDLAARSVATGLGPCAVVSAEIFSDIVAREEPRCFSIFGDAAGAAVLGRHEADEGVLGVSLRTDPTPGLTASMEHPRWSREHRPIRFGIGNRAMAEGAVEYLVRAAREALDMAGLRIEQIDWVLPHQPNGFMFDEIVTALEVPPGRTLKIVDEIGSTGSASIPVSLDRLLRSGRLKAGQTVLMVSIGAGVGYGGLVFRTGPGLPTAS